MERELCGIPTKDQLEKMDPDMEMSECGECGGDMAVQSVNRSQSDIMEKYVAAWRKSQVSMLTRVAYGPPTPRITAAGCLRHFLCILHQLLVFSVFVALIVDYRVIRATVEHYGSTILSRNAMAWITSAQMFVQFYVIRVTQTFTGFFPYIPYVPGYWELICEYIVWMLFYPATVFSGSL